MNSILLYVGGDAAMDDRLEAAVTLARGRDAQVTCLQAVPMSAMIDNRGYFGFRTDPPSQRFDELRWQKEHLRALVTRRLNEEAISHRWVSDTNMPGVALGHAGHLADIILVGLVSRGRALGPPSSIGRLALRARSPVLAVPHSGIQFDPDGTAVIAWNGSLEAADAIRASRSLLKRARQVHLVTVRDGCGARRPNAVIDYLSSHGIKMDSSHSLAHAEPVSQVLIDAVRRLSGRYLIMGAYGHSPLREAVFGGVTSELLHAAAFPLVLAH